MSRTDYQKQLYRLRETVLEMSDVVCSRFRRALEALETGNVSTARTVVEGDHEINDLYLDLEGDCIDLLALQQPVAGDLRFVAASFKIITDLERVGDLAVNLAEYATDAAETDRVPHPAVDVTAIGERAIRMLEDAMAAYSTDDSETTRQIAARDDDIDARCERASRAVVRELVESETDADANDDGDSDSDSDADSMLEAASLLLLTIRDLERVGDHAVNVAARTLYMVDTDDELIY